MNKAEAKRPAAIAVDFQWNSNRTMLANSTAKAEVGDVPDVVLRMLGLERSLRAFTTKGPVTQYDVDRLRRLAKKAAWWTRDDAPRVNASMLHSEWTKSCDRILAAVQAADPSPEGGKVGA